MTMMHSSRNRLALMMRRGRLASRRAFSSSSLVKNEISLQMNVAVIGGGINGLATAYYLAKNHSMDVTILDALPQPMAFTSAQSGENYRNWWPHPVMTAFTERSLTLMEDINANVDIGVTRKGYLLATRDAQRAEQLLQQLVENSAADDDNKIRIHDGATSQSYNSSNTTALLDGVDILQNKDLIQQHYPQLNHDDDNVHSLFHIRRAGDLSGHALGTYFLNETRRMGGKFLGNASVVDMQKQQSQYLLEIQQTDSTSTTSMSIVADKVVNAAGPMAAQVAKTLSMGKDLPLYNVFHQKVAFPDVAKVIPRHLPFLIDLDPQHLDWSPDEREALLEDDSGLAWLAQEFPGCVHCRPDGPRNVKLGWAFENNKSMPELLTTNQYLNPYFPEVVLRGASRLQPALKAYVENLPPKQQLSHYGGWYSMTEENWPLIGPASDDTDDLYINCAPSGFGTMAACAAGELCAAWVADDAPLPEYAQALSIHRYQDAALMETLRGMDKGLL